MIVRIFARTAMRDSADLKRSHSAELSAARINGREFFESFLERGFAIRFT
jgi:hypothetical protein